jgi:hypothetical protein
LSSIVALRVVKIVEHQIHIFLLLTLKVVVDFGISMHLDFDVRIGLPGKGSGLCEVGCSLKTWRELLPLSSALWLRNQRLVTVARVKSIPTRLMALLEVIIRVGAHSK